ncbi:Cysteine protease [Rhynchospora pubera]|uniref:Cysteine protease n=1 Tax=Rhynchospora pubera TaxID=906938 RepID=A0AAV8CCC2_9POAL|nr:Cysteine protease [Rhynchospora pubera]
MIMATFISLKPLALFLGFLFWSLVLATSSSNESSLMLVEFEKWVSDYGRLYESETEKSKRFNIFKANYEYIQEKNKEPGLTYTLGLNEFADLTNEEFVARYTGALPPTDADVTIPAEPFKFENLSAPASIDWRSYGAVTPVKNQGSCGSCWAFSAVASIEGAVRLRKGTLLSLSEQELVDCVTTCNKCSGGWPASAFQWVISNRGIATEAYYPYSGTNGFCNGNLASYRAASITGYVNVPQYNEMALMYAVAMQPVSVALEATSTSFQFYRGGIYSGPCGNTLNHAVTIIGYGVAGDGMKYWIIKNSWGPTWGVGGYMYIQKEVYNLPAGLCGLAMAPSYPIASPYASA